MAKLKYIKNGQINDFGFSNGGSSASIDDNATSKDKTWSSDKISQNLDNIANKIKGSNVVNLEKYGIVQADYSYPFTTENYDVAYQNGVGLQNAIDDARNNGITELIIPAGNYPLCYSGSDATNHDNAIVTIEGVDIIANNCKFYVIYDDLCTGINTHYTGDLENAYLLSYKIFKTDSRFVGAEIVGERAYRTHARTNHCDSSYGIALTKESNGNRIKNCKIHHISGDGIGNSGAMQQLATWLEGADALATAVTFDYSTKTFVPSTISYTTPRHSIGWADITKPMQIRGKNYFIWSIHPLKIHCFKGILSEDGSYSEGDYIGSILVNQGEPFYFLEETYYFYIEVVDSAEHTEYATSTIGVAIGYGLYCNTVIEGCDLYANQRGGLSNLPSGTIVKNCTIRHNGGEYEDMVAYYDGTQFGIDIEDWFIHSITIDNCLFYGNSNAILYRCHGIKILDSIIDGNVSALNYAIDFYAENTRFKNDCKMANGGASFGKRTAIGCKFEGNVADAIDVIEKSKEYELPIATSNTLGGVKPITKATSMTQPVGIDENGLLYTAPTTSTGSSTDSSNIDWKLIKEITTDGINGLIEVSEDTEGNTLNLKEICIFANLKSANESNSASFVVSLNNISVYTIANSISNSSFNNYLVNLVLVGNYVKVQYGKGTSKGRDFSDNYNSFQKINITNINSIKILSNANFVEGCTIVIYGR